ncbi:PepSY domain-containing protein [Neiella marina]|uniref:PepSY domain-containing protein n=1 Tax=Neiella holothuriorum TaxID=2870530 RepID=A0ABS7EE33_9GAMM|nr:PepSY-associated TM helix domain-containing protein [Neiella holothuriorum]MBW8190611.1 PepSY domain-containing protein [Neiella holothuriorum]
MKSINIKKLYAIHSWVGIITGILLFVVAFTGAVAVFARPELKIWASPEIRTPAQVDPIQVERLVHEYAAMVPDNHFDAITIAMPGMRSATALEIRYEYHGHDHENGGPDSVIQYQFDPHSYELLGEKQGDFETLFDDYQYDMADFIANFHADLHLGRPVGLLITGLLGLTLLASLVTGVIIHRKILRQLFTFRPFKGFSLLMNDGHKVMGVWGMLFHGLIGFTGAFLGLALVILVPAAAYVSYQGDMEALIEDFTSTPDPVIAHIEQPTQIAKPLQHALSYHPDSKLRTARILGYGDANAVIYSNLIGGPQMHTLILEHQGASGEFVQAFGNYSKIEGVSGIVLDIMFPAHFGNFGGVLVKAIWTLLGLSTALLPLSGLMLWLERGLNASQPKYSLQTYQRFNRLVIGACGGVVLATAQLFPLQLVLSFTNLNLANNQLVFGSFFASWLLCIMWALVRFDAAHTVKWMTRLTAGLLLIVMPLDVLLTGSHLLNVLSTGHYVSVAVDWVLFAIGGLLWWLSLRWKPNSAAFLSTAETSQLALSAQLTSGRVVEEKQS